MNAVLNHKLMGELISYFFQAVPEAAANVVAYTQNYGLVATSQSFMTSVGAYVHSYLLALYRGDQDTFFVSMAGVTAIAAAVVTRSYLTFLDITGSGCFYYDGQKPNIFDLFSPIGNYLGFFDSTVTDRVEGHETVFDTSSGPIAESSTSSNMNTGSNTMSDLSTPSSYLNSVSDAVSNENVFYNFLNWFGNYTETLRWQGPNSKYSNVNMNMNIDMNMTTVGFLKIPNTCRLPSGIDNQKSFSDVFSHAQQIISSYTETEYCSKKGLAQGFSDIINSHFDNHPDITPEQLMTPELPPDEFLVMFTLIAISSSYLLYKNSKRLKKFIASIISSPFAIFSGTDGHIISEYTQELYDLYYSDDIHSDDSKYTHSSLEKLDLRILLLDHYISIYKSIAAGQLSEDIPADSIIPNFIRMVEDKVKNYNTDNRLITIFGIDTSEYEDVNDLNILFRDIYSDMDISDYNERLGVEIYMYKVIMMVGTLRDKVISAVENIRKELFDRRCSIESGRVNIDMLRNNQEFLEENLQVKNATIPNSTPDVVVETIAPNVTITVPTTNPIVTTTTPNVLPNPSDTNVPTTPVAANAAERGMWSSIKGLPSNLLVYLYNKTPIFGKVIIPLILGGILHSISPEWVKNLMFLAAAIRTVKNAAMWDIPSTIWDLLVYTFSKATIGDDFNLYTYRWMPLLWQRYIPAPAIKDVGVALSSIGKVFIGASAMILYLKHGAINLDTIASIHITNIKGIAGSFPSKIYQMSTKIVSKFIDLFTTIKVNIKVIGAIITIFTISALGYSFGSDIKMLTSIAGEQLFTLFSSIGNAANNIINTSEAVIEKVVETVSAATATGTATGTVVENVAKTVAETAKSVEKVAKDVVPVDEILHTKLATNMTKLPPGGPSSTIAKGQTFFELVRDSITANAAALFPGFDFPGIGWIIALIIGLIVMMLSSLKSTVGEQDEKVGTKTMKLKLDKFYGWIEHMELRLKLQDELFVQVTSGYDIEKSEILEILGILKNYNSGFVGYDNHLKNWCSIMINIIQDNNLEQNFLAATEYWITTIDNDIVEVEKFISEIPTMKVREVMLEDMNDILDITNKLLSEHFQLL